MRPLYPAIQPYKTHALEVGGEHTLYVEESGNAGGLPVLFVHGGPGGSTNGDLRSFFNPEKYRIILFDQRGCGRSQPHASLQENTTAHLIEDMEHIRTHLDVDEWLLFGGSWGATLAILYAQAHTKRTLGLILRGVFLARQQDIHWLYQEGASRIFPDYWQDFLTPIPAGEQHNLLHAYHQRLTSENELQRMAAAKAWSVWEGRCSSLAPNPDAMSHYSDPHLALAMARLETHYFINHCFINENQILTQADKISGLPITIVHGRYDMVCPVEQAYALYQALPHSQLHIVRDAGHSVFERGIIDSLVRATDAFAATEA